MSALLIKLDSSNVPETKAPILESNFRMLFTTQSYPVPLSVPSVDGSGYGLYKRTSQPTASGVHKKIVEQTPALNSDGYWYQTWTEEDMTDEEKTETDNLANTNERAMRNIYLTNSDWTQLPDTGLGTSKKDEWTTYRQALRDLPSTSGSNWPHNITWPTKPS